MTPRIPKSVKRFSDKMCGEIKRIPKSMKQFGLCIAVNQNADFNQFVRSRRMPGNEFYFLVFW